MRQVIVTNADGGALILPPRIEAATTVKCARLPFTDGGNAARMAARFGHALRWHPVQGWLIRAHDRWTGKDAMRAARQAAMVTAGLVLDEALNLRAKGGAATSRANVAQLWSRHGQADQHISRTLLLARRELTIRPSAGPTGRSTNSRAARCF